jgi:hypothetical protein
VKYTRFWIPANFYFSVPGTGKTAEKNARAFLSEIDDNGWGWGIPYDGGADTSLDPVAIVWLGDGNEGNEPGTVELHIEDSGDA